MTKRGNAVRLEESFDFWVCRPLGKRVATWLLKTPITANQVSGLAALCGMIAGLCYALPWPYPGVGAVFAFGMMVLDCSDGEVARRRGGGDWRGRIVDGLSDLVSAVAIHAGMLVHLARSGVVVLDTTLGVVPLFLLALISGAAMSWHCAVVDDVKQRLKTHSVDREFVLYALDVRSRWDRFLYAALRRYIRNMTLSTGPRRPGGYRCFRRAQWVGPTHHHLLMVLAGLGAAYSPRVFLVFLLMTIFPVTVYLLLVLRAAPSGGDATEERSSDPGLEIQT